ncbi:MAG: hypothetical protein K8F91_20455, partial [Candidatus Obscuribacterales bacterium]|nr:hypothetical protein [Candidatus Obscuribacterales bacterium]
MKRNHLTFMVAALMLAGLFSVAQEPASAHERCWNNSGNQNARAYRKRIKHHKKAWRNQANNRPASV